MLTIGAEGGPKGNLAKARAHWVAEDTIAWNLSGVQPDWAVQLHVAPDGGLVLGADGVTGGADIPLVYDPAGLSAEIRAPSSPTSRATRPSTSRPITWMRFPTR